MVYTSGVYKTRYVYDGQNKLGVIRGGKGHFVSTIASSLQYTVAGRASNVSVLVTEFLMPIELITCGGMET